MNLTQASRQWAVRPDDERFWTLQEAAEAARRSQFESDTQHLTEPKLTVKAVKDDLFLTHGKDRLAFSHYSFGQLAVRAGAPADYLRKLPTKLAADCVNSQLTEDRRDCILLSRGGTLRSITSQTYGRVWDTELFDLLRPATDHGWRVPPARPAREGQTGTRPATKDDVLQAGQFGLSVKVGDAIAPAGIYVSDRDMFVFMVNEAMIDADGTPIGRGFFLTNSEVGAATLSLTTFLYRHVCGNHIVWGAERVNSIKVRHRGDTMERFHWKSHRFLKEWQTADLTPEVAAIKLARKMELGTTADAIVTTLEEKRVKLPPPKYVFEKAFSLGEKHADTDSPPSTLWGLAQALTRYSQTLTHQDKRAEIDLFAGRLMQLAV